MKHLGGEGLFRQTFHWSSEVVIEVAPIMFPHGCDLSQSKKGFLNSFLIMLVVLARLSGLSWSGMGGPTVRPPGPNMRRRAGWGRCWF